MNLCTVTQLILHGKLNKKKVTPNGDETETQGAYCMEEELLLIQAAVNV